MALYNIGKHYNSREYYNVPYPPPWYSYLAFAQPIVLDEDKKQIAILDKAYNIVSEECLDAEHKLTFRIPINDSKAVFLEDRTLIDLAGIHYRIIGITDQEESGGTQYKIIEAWARWFELLQATEIVGKEFTQATVEEVLDYLLPGTGWSKGIILALTPVTGLPIRRDIICQSGSNRLADLRSIAVIFGVDLSFDTVGCKVNYYPKGVNTGLFFLRGKNLKFLEIENDSTDLIHRIYPHGYEGMGIESVNEGVPYLEVSSPFTPPPCATLRDERFTDPVSLKEYAQKYLNEYSISIKYYIVKVIDLFPVSTYVEGKLYVGNVVSVYTEELGEVLSLKIVRLIYRPEEPWNSEVELATMRKDLASLLGKQFAPIISEWLALSQLMVFNYLLNSRADDGFANWVNDGWEIDNEEGYSGPASFTVTGALEVSKTLSQTVFPSHREHFVLSLRCSKSNIILGENGKVGVEIVVTYEDDSTETIFIPLN